MGHTGRGHMVCHRWDGVWGPGTYAAREREVDACGGAATHRRRFMMSRQSMVTQPCSSVSVMVLSNEYVDSTACGVGGCGGGWWRG